jgi:TonB family protein
MKSTADIRAHIALPQFHFPLPPLFSGFSVSLFVHTAVLTAGLWWVGGAAHSYSGPSEFELVDANAAFESGTHARKQKSAPTPVVDRSELDEAVLKPKAAKKIENESQGASTIDSKGQAGTASVATGTVTNVWQQYGASVRQAILQGFSYPPASRAMGETGQVKIAFAVLPDGSLVDVSVSNPSPHERLNSAAVALVRKVGNVGVLPDPYLPRWNTEIAINFELN